MGSALKSEDLHADELLVCFPRLWHPSSSSSSSSLLRFSSSSLEISSYYGSRLANLVEEWALDQGRAYWERSSAARNTSWWCWCLKISSSSSSSSSWQLVVFNVYFYFFILGSDLVFGESKNNNYEDLGISLLMIKRNRVKTTKVRQDAWCFGSSVSKYNLKWVSFISESREKGNQTQQCRSIIDQC